ncbi:MAG: hypothetical protein K8M05_17250 [Deltaproteobacteria bacterium]|nr:hypothetical protein [Kofleriaceae bacterium]
MRGRRALVVVGALAATATPAAADEPPFTIGGQPAWFVMAGATAGGTVAIDTRGGFVGGEVSLARVVEAHYLGLYVDAYRDFGVDGTYLTFGPELGWVRRSRTLPVSLGLDGGGAVRFSDERALGATGRVFFVVAGTVALFARYAYLDAAEDDHVVQLGVTMKFPMWRVR